MPVGAYLLRLLQQAPYKLNCDRDPLNGRLGAPDYYPQTSDCPEETLNRDYLQHGYKETVDGLEEAREIVLSQLGTFTKPVVVKCKEAIRKRLRAINESRAQKRKVQSGRTWMYFSDMQQAGQVYGVPLSGQLLNKPCVFPEQKPCSEDFRNKWIEVCVLKHPSYFNMNFIFVEKRAISSYFGLSQPHKRLRLLSDQVPHGFRRKSLFEVLIRHNVPLLRATWFIKVTYLNQVRPVSSSVSSSSPDKTQLARSELWTKDIIEYLQYLLDEFISKDGSLSTPPKMSLVGMAHQKSDASPVLDGEEPSLHFKWRYMARILQWHHSEGLLITSHIIDWVLNQLQVTYPFFFCIIFECKLWFYTPKQGSKYPMYFMQYLMRCIKYMYKIRYVDFQEKESLVTLQLLLPVVFSVIETVALSQTYVRNLVDVAVHSIQEPYPACLDLVANSRRAYIVSSLVGMLRYLMLAVPDTFVVLDCFPLPSCVLSEAVNYRTFLSNMSEDAVKIQNGPRNNATTDIDKGVNYAVLGIQKRVQNLSKAVSPGLQGHSVAKAVQALDKALLVGDVREAYNFLFNDLYDGDVEEGWVADVSSCLRASLKWIGTVSLSLICSVFFLCEWATCDFRDCRTSEPSGLKFTGRKDYSEVYIVVQLLKLQIEDKCDSFHKTSNKNKSMFFGDGACKTDIFQSPGPMHDIIVCWIDQHEAGKIEGLKRLQLLMVELIRSGIFYPQTYVRQLIVSGTMDRSEAPTDFERQKKHYRILKQLPGPYLLNWLKEANVADVSLLLEEAISVYSNERRFLLHGPVGGYFRDGTSSSVSQAQKVGKIVKAKSQVIELKAAISLFLHLPSSYPAPDTRQDETQGSLKRPGEKIDMMEETGGCEECRRVKRQKSSEDRSTYYPSNPSDDEDNWWMRKAPKFLESPFKVDPPLTKSIKQASRGRQKNGRKTQSLAQLAATRIENSQGASTSHACDDKLSCPHRRSGTEGQTPMYVDGVRTKMHLDDILKIGKALKSLRLLERMTLTVWLITSIKQLFEGTERSTVRWKLGEDELLAILYLMDVSLDLVSAIKFLLWLLTKIPNYSTSNVHGGRNVSVVPKSAEGHAFEVGEAFLLSSIRRYENILVAADLIPEALSALMDRAVAVMVTNGRASSSSSFVYARILLKKYANVASVAKWENFFKGTCDQRLLAELESGRSPDDDFGFSPGIPSGVEDLDGYFRQKVSGRLSRAGPTMKEIVQRQVDEAVNYFYGKEKKLLSAGAPKSLGIEKHEDGYQIAQKIVFSLMDYIRQNGGAGHEGDLSLVASAVSAIVGNVGPTIVKMSDFTAVSASNHQNNPSPISFLNCARGIAQIHIACLCLLKEALGERQFRVFEIALATEASSVVAVAFSPGKSSRSQIPDAHDANTNLSNEILNNSAKAVLARATKVVAAVSAIVVGAVVHGVTSLERIIAAFRLKEGLDILQFIRSARSGSNGTSRSFSSLKVDNSIEINLHWFRLLIGNGRTLCDGLIVELLGEPYILALSRMQRMLPLNLVFPPTYSIFGMLIWRLYITNGNIASREDVQVHQSLTFAIDDVIKHQPFRDICLHDTRAFYDCLASDVGDSEFAAILESNGSDKHLKRAFIPLRARLFLNSILDCKLRIPGDGHPESEVKLCDQLVHVLDNLQPAKFHWQWVELRLLLNEQVLIDKIEGSYNMSLVEAIRSLALNSDSSVRSDSENYFTEIILTRLLVRPDAAPLYSEVVHLLGMPIVESLLTNAKWFLGGQDVQLGRKSIRQRLVTIALSKNLSTKVQFWKPWGWSNSGMDTGNIREKKFESTLIEEGEVVDEGTDLKRSNKGTATSQKFDNVEGVKSINSQCVTERALAELVLQCMDRSSSDNGRCTFASELIKHMNNIEQQICLLTGGVIKPGGTTLSGVEGGVGKGNSRKGTRGVSPGFGRRLTGAAITDTSPPSSAALRASMWLRLQFLLKLLPIIQSEREPSGRNMKHMLASVILRLLGSRIVYEDADLSFYPMQKSSSKKEIVSPMEASDDASLDLSLSGESLFDQFLSVFYGLLSNCKPSWLKPKSVSKSTVKSPRDFSVFDREVAESLQNDLDRMQLPETVRWRLQAAMPVLPRFPLCSISCQPPAISNAALAPLHGLQSGNANLPQKNSILSSRGKPKPSLSQDQDIEVDPWTLLEDGTGSGPPSSHSNVGVVSGDHSNLKACSWLKGAVRVRRTDLTYIGAVDDDS
ncbi:hypothetical protein GIB67_022786 [Kingdonia uniflora]|uniref:Mediator complex subunit Med12 domain-containing protein n=1 Tax=Kingdonia uniflora TaxID=39325 RepID=A0A7J7P6N5_9MAGN|nr:hypothetical protein GIB67_022786 [Kingdonia uniflora]